MLPSDGSVLNGLAMSSGASHGLGGSVPYMLRVLVHNEGHARAVLTKRKMMYEVHHVYFNLFNETVSSFNFGTANHIAHSTMNQKHA